MTFRDKADEETREGECDKERGKERMRASKPSKLVKTHSSPGVCTCNVKYAA